MCKRVLFLSILVLFPVSALAETTPCNIRREKAISFSEDKPTDKLIVTIRGRTCDTAVERIRIVSSTGKLLYQHSEPLRNYLAAPNAGIAVCLSSSQFEYVPQPCRTYGHES